MYEIRTHHLNSNPELCQYVTHYVIKGDTAEHNYASNTGPGFKIQHPIFIQKHLPSKNQNYKT
jgi:hypothetical protein